jgi:Tfp pilus assembly protein PilO
VKALKVEQQAAVVVAAAVLLSILLGYFVVVAPVRSRGAHLQREIADVRGQLALADARASQAAQQPSDGGAADAVSLAKALPGGVEMPNLLLELDQVARDTGVDFDSIEPSELVPANGYQSIPLTASFRGNFFQISDFLYRLRNLVVVRDGRVLVTGRLFDVSSIELKENPGTFPRLDASLMIDAFLLGSTSAVNSTSTASGTPSTETSTTASTEAAGAQP